MQRAYKAQTKTGKRYGELWILDFDLSKCIPGQIRKDRSNGWNLAYTDQRKVGKRFRELLISNFEPTPKVASEVLHAIR